MKFSFSLSNEERNLFEKSIKEIKEEVSQSTKLNPSTKSVLKILQRFKSSENQRLKKWHRQEVKGRDIAQCRSDAMDVIIEELLETALKENKISLKNEGFCVIALGGYGRRELSPYSDIDIMFLQETESIKPSTEKIVSSILMVLWDLGLKVGHATRSLTEAIDHANQDMLSKTAMLEMRLIRGDKKVFKKVKEQFFKKCIHNKKKNMSLGG